MRPPDELQRLNAEYDHVPCRNYKTAETANSLLSSAMRMTADAQVAELERIYAIAAIA